MRFFLLTILLSVVLASCVPFSTLTADKNPYQLPIVHGVVSYQNTIIKKGIKFDEFYRAARVWFRANKDVYALEWERPIYKATLLQSAIIPSSRVLDSQTDYYSHRTVHYLITIYAKDDSCRVLLSNFEVYDATSKSRFGTELEKLASDKDLCESVNREGGAVVESLGKHIQKNAEKSF